MTPRRLIATVAVASLLLWPFSCARITATSSGGTHRLCILWTRAEVEVWHGRHDSGVIAGIVHSPRK